MFRVISVWRYHSVRCSNLRPHESKSPCHISTRLFSTLSISNLVIPQCHFVRTGKGFNRVMFSFDCSKFSLFDVSKRSWDPNTTSQSEITLVLFSVAHRFSWLEAHQEKRSPTTRTPMFVHRNHGVSAESSTYSFKW